MENPMHSSHQNRQFRSLGWEIRSLLGLIICFSVLLFGLLTPAMAGQTPSLQAKAELSQANKAIALRYAKEGWGTQSNWEKTWDELVASDVVLHFNSFPDPIGCDRKYAVSSN
jgi:hypothetical protein